MGEGNLANLGKNPHHQQGQPGPARRHHEIVTQQNQGDGQAHQGKVKHDHHRIFEGTELAHNGIGQPAAERAGDGNAHRQGIVTGTFTAKQKCRTHHHQQPDKTQGNAQ